MSRQDSSGAFVLDNDIRPNSAARGELTNEFHPAWLGHCDQIVENGVGDVLVERSVIPVLLQVQLQRFQLEAVGIRNVSDRQRAKIGLAGLGANRSEFRANGFDGVVPLRERVIKGFQHLAEISGHLHGFPWRTVNLHRF